MADAAGEAGLSSAEAARRLHQLGPPPETSSRSVSSIVAGNVFTLFNLILGVFFVVVLSLGLFADALFGLIAIVNSYIGIRQEMKAKEVLDQLAVLVAPKASVVRDGRLHELVAEEVVPGDLVRVQPGDQLVADGEVIRSRGLTLDESLLTGESEGVRRVPGDRVLSGAFGIAARAPTRSTRSASAATRASSPARRALFATRSPRSRRRSTGCCWRPPG